MKLRVYKSDGRWQVATPGHHANGGTAAGHQRGGRAMMADPAWEKLRGPTYKIYSVAGNWFSRLVLDRYLVVAPGGRSVGTTLTLRGARRKLRRRQEDRRA